MKKITIIIGVLILTFTSFHFLLKEIDTYRVSSGLSEGSAYDALLPSEFVGTVALGGFRAAAVNFFWVRAMDAWEKKIWYEALTLYRLISKLQPRLANIWIINAWNMIYNISVDFNHKEQQELSWEWIKEGVDFLKEGINRNPKSPELHFYLGWVYYDKGKNSIYREYFLKRGEHPVKEACYYIGKAAEFAPPTYYFYNYWYSFMLRERALIEESEGNISEAFTLINDSITALRLAEKSVPKHPDFQQFEDGIKMRLKELDERKVLLEKMCGSSMQADKRG
ncbi:MAG: hypothetical protein L3J17_04790 [Candidatus Jettenia sp.]|nr:MAG: hypothetical protein L3J17_04790 [Candidatus Jettenia sp.]